MFSQLFFTLLFSSQVFANPTPMKVINPDGEENLGLLEVQLPQLSTKDKENYLPGLQMYFDEPGGERINVTQIPKIRSKAGEACFKTSQNVGKSTVESSECKIKISEGKTSLMALAAVRLDYDRSLIKTDFGKPIQFFWNQSYALIATDMPKANEYFALLPSPLSIGIGYDGQMMSPEWKQSVIPGQKNVFSLPLPDLRTAVIFEEPERTMPSPQGTCASSWQVMGSDGRSYVGVLAGVEQYYIEKNLRLSVNQQLVLLPDTPGQVQHLKVERIDVNDVLITDEKGEKSYVNGTYQVFPIHQDAVTRMPALKLPGKRNGDCWGTARDRFNTKSGMDVLPGLYHVVVDFTTALGPQTKTYVVDLR